VAKSTQRSSSASHQICVRVFFKYNKYRSKYLT